MCVVLLTIEVVLTAYFNAALCGRRVLHITPPDVSRRPFILLLWFSVLTFRLGTVYRGYCKCLASLVGPVHVLSAGMFL